MVIELTRWFEDDRQVVEHLDALFAFEPHGQGRTGAEPAPAGPPPDDRAGTEEWSRFACGPTGVSARFPSSPRYEQARDTLFGTRHQLHHEHDGLSVALDVTEIDDHGRGERGDHELERVASGIAQELDADGRGPRTGAGR